MTWLRLMLFPRFLGNTIELPSNVVGHLMRHRFAFWKAIAQQEEKYSIPYTVFSTSTSADSAGYSLFGRSNSARLSRSAMSFSMSRLSMQAMIAFICSSVKFALGFVQPVVHFVCDWPFLETCFSAVLDFFLISCTIFLRWLGGLPPLDPLL